MTDALAAPVAAPVEEVAAPPTPISVEPRTAPAGEAAEIARQAAESKAAATEKPVKTEPAKAEDKPKPPATPKDAIRAARERLEAKEAAERATPLRNDPKAAEPAAKAEPKAAELAKAEPARGDDGKFVSSKPAEPAAKVEPAAKAAEPAPAKTDNAKAAEPAKPAFTAEPAPKRFVKAAQDRWAEAPEEVRGEVLRMESEFTKGLEKHRAAAARDADLNEFHEMATKGNTTVKEALTKYTGMEKLLRSDFDKGIEAIFQNVGKSPREWAEKLLGQAPDVVAGKTDATITELRNQNAALERRLAAIEGRETDTRTTNTHEAVAKFAADPAHSRFEELSEDIAFFLKTRCPGDLAKAYELAERLNPAPAKGEPEPKPAPAAASEAEPKPAASDAVTNVTPLVKPASSAGQKSISGAPIAGSDPARKQPSSSIKEALKRARSAVG